MGVAKVWERFALQNTYISRILFVSLFVNAGHFLVLCLAHAARRLLAYAPVRSTPFRDFQSARAFGRTEFKHYTDSTLILPLKLDTVNQPLLLKWICLKAKFNIQGGGQKNHPNRVVLKKWINPNFAWVLSVAFSARMLLPDIWSGSSFWVSVHACWCRQNNHSCTKDWLTHLVHYWSLKVTFKLLQMLASFDRNDSCLSSDICGSAKWRLKQCPRNFDRLLGYIARPSRYLAYC